MAEMKGMEGFEALIARLDQVGDDDEAAIEKAFYATEGTSEDVSEELSEADLENVSGGLSELDVIKWLIKNTKCGQMTWTSTKVAAVCLYDYFKYGNAYKTYSRSYVSELSKDLENSIPNWIKAIAKATSW